MKDVIGQTQAGDELGHGTGGKEEYDPHINDGEAPELEKGLPGIQSFRLKTEIGT